MWCEGKQREFSEAFLILASLFDANGSTLRFRLQLLALCKLYCAIFSSSTITRESNSFPPSLSCSFCLHHLNSILLKCDLLWDGGFSCKALRRSDAWHYFLLSSFFPLFIRSACVWFWLFFYAKQKLGPSALAMPRGFGLSFHFGRESSKRVVNWLAEGS